MNGVPPLLELNEINFELKISDFHIIKELCKVN
jgi:hypothetical protein